MPCLSQTLLHGGLHVTCTRMAHPRGYSLVVRKRGLVFLGLGIHLIFPPFPQIMTTCVGNEGVFEFCSEYCLPLVVIKRITHQFLIALCYWVINIY